MSTVQVNVENNVVSAQPVNYTIQVIEQGQPVIDIVDPRVEVITVGIPGVTGPKGDQGDIPAGFNQLTASFNAFTSSYNTGSFTGSFYGDGSQLTGIVSSKWTGSNPLTRQSDVQITGSLSVLGSVTSSSDITVNGVTIGKGKGNISSNLAIGFGTLANFVAGANSNNTAVGAEAMISASTGNYNAAVGSGAMYKLGTGAQNAAFGSYAMYNNGSGSANTAIGYSAMQLATGSYNTALGNLALASNVGDNNTAVGYRSGVALRSGQDNVSLGRSSLTNAINANYNTALGSLSLFNISAPGNGTSSYNIAIGYEAGRRTSTFFLYSSSYALFIGTDTKPLADNSYNETIIGHLTTGSGNNTVTIGNTAVTLTQLRGQVRTTGGFSGSFLGDGGGLTSISASAIVGLNLSQIAAGNVTASVSTGTGSFNISSGSTNFLFISSSGNVGIGIPNPGYKLDISSSAAGGAIRVLHNNTLAFQVTGSRVVVGNGIGGGAAFEVYNAGSRLNNILIGSAGGNFLGSTGGNFGLNLLASGLAIGAGVLTPSAYLHVFGASILGGNTLVNTTSSAGFTFDVSGSARITNGLTVTGSLIADSITGSLLGTASYAVSAPMYLPLTGGTISGDLIVAGTASINYLNVTYESASVIYTTGSNQLGDAINDTQTLYGSVVVPTGSLTVTGSIAGTGLQIAGSTIAVGGIATNASFNSVLTASANNDVLVGVDITPTFRTSPYTGVAGYALRINNNGTVYFAGSGNPFSAHTLSTSNEVMTFTNNNSNGRFNITHNVVSAQSKLSVGYAPGVTTALNHTLYVNGTVGVNTSNTSAGYQFDVNGTARVSSFLDIGDSNVRFTNASSHLTLQLDGNNRTFTINARDTIFGAAINTAMVVGNGLLTVPYYNTSLGSAINTGYRLDVNGSGAASGSLRAVSGSVLFKGADVGATSTFRVENSGSVSLLETLNDGTTYISTPTYSTNHLALRTGGTSTVLAFGGSAGAGYARIASGAPSLNIYSTRIVLGPGDVNNNTVLGIGYNGQALVGGYARVVLGSTNAVGDFNINAGNIGIGGIATPNYRLDLNTSGSVSGSLQISGSTIQPVLLNNSLTSVNIVPTMIYTTGSQTQTALKVLATFSGSSAFSSSQSNIIADFGATSVGSQLIVTDVTSGSIYMVNDVSGIPILEANSNWDVFMYDYPYTVFKKTGSAVEMGVVGQPSSSVTIKSDLIINEGLGFTNRTLQVSGSTTGSVTSSLYNITFTNTSASVYMSAVVTGYDTGSRETITGDIKATIKYANATASVVGYNQTFFNADNSVVGFDIIAGGTSGSLVAYGTGSRVYQFGATVNVQVI